MAGKMRNILILILSVILCVSIISCAKKETIIIGGSTTVLPIISNAAEYFKGKNPNLNIIVNAGGSGVGVTQLGEGKIQIGMISRDLTDSEMKRHPDVNYIIHKIGKDAVVPVVSSEIYESGIKSLTIEQIGKIYKGEIDNWNVLGGPHRNILVIDKERSRGTRHIFMKFVLGHKDADAPGADLVLGSNNEEQTAISQSDAAIGMLSHAWLNDDVKGLSIIMPDKSVIDPILDNILNGTYPIARDLLLITNGEPVDKTRKFIDFVLSSEGQRIVEEAGYVSIIQ